MFQLVVQEVQSEKMIYRHTHHVRFQVKIRRVRSTGVTFETSQRVNVSHDRHDRSLLLNGPNRRYADRIRVSGRFLALSPSCSDISLAIVPSISISYGMFVAEVALYELCAILVSASTMSLNFHKRDV